MSTTWRFKLDDLVFFPDPRQSGGFVRGMVVALPRLADRKWPSGLTIKAGWYVVACEDGIMRAVDASVLREGINNVLPDRTVTKWRDSVWKPKHLQS